MSRRILSFAIKFAVSAFLVWLLARGIDLKAVGQQIADADRLWLAISVLLAATVLPIASIRWQLVAAAVGDRLTTRDAISFNMIGWFFNTTLPSTVGGDGVRIYLAYRGGSSKTGAVHAVLIDRLIGLFVVLAMASVFFVPLAAGLGEFQKWFLAGLIVCGYGAYAVFLLLSAKFAGRLESFRVGQLLRAISQDARKTLLSPTPGAMILVISLVVQMVQFASIYAIAIAVDADVSFTTVMIAVPAVLLVSSMPVSLAGWGVREQTMIVAMGAMGVGATDALTISVLLGLSLMVIGLPGAVLWLVHRPERGTVAE